MRDSLTGRYVQWLHANGDEGEANKRIEALLRAVAPEEVDSARAALGKLQGGSRSLLNGSAHRAHDFGVRRHKLA